jgi:hypothetical protein
MKEQDMIKRRNPTGLDLAPDIRTMENAFIVALMRSEKKSGQNLKEAKQKPSDLISEGSLLRII